MRQKKIYESPVFWTAGIRTESGFAASVESTTWDDTLSKQVVWGEDNTMFE